MTQSFDVRVAFLDVGQADNIIVSIPEAEEAVVIDCYDADATVTYLQQQNIKHLRGLIITHLHLDHYRGAVELLEHCESKLNLTCERLLFNWPALRGRYLQRLLQDSDGHSEQLHNNRERLTAFQELLSWSGKNANICQPLIVWEPNHSPIRGKIGNVLSLIHPKHAHIYTLSSLGLNNTSGVIKVYGKSSSALLLGDLEPPGWELLQEQSENLEADVMKFPHHGAWKNGDVDKLLDTVNPSLIAISVGTAGTKYNHPNTHVFEAIARRKRIRLMCTQVTEQCEQALYAKRQAIVRMFEKQILSNDGFFIERKNECPCAGTIVIDLSEFATVVQPSSDFHQIEVINAHFAENKCSIVSKPDG